MNDDEVLGQVLGAALNRRGWTLAVAESCTGGNLAGAITSVAGASRYMKGGIVAYANEVKELLLGVPKETLETHGAVSEPTARAMAEGVRIRLATQMGVGITGVAGPDGGSAEKPVGLVFVAVATPEGTVTRHDIWPGDRTEVRAASVRAALRLMIDCIEQV
ncbi:MAG: CinA family protein [Chloroflexi bacterium]|nr:CinA family protein [Chloroflexota bacterium]